jgi:hypothetical protein
VSDDNPPIRIPEDEDGVHEIAAEGEKDDSRVSDEQRRNLATVQAELIGDL